MRNHITRCDNLLRNYSMARAGRGLGAFSRHAYGDPFIYVHPIVFKLSSTLKYSRPTHCQCFQMFARYYQCISPPRLDLVWLGLPVLTPLQKFVAHRYPFGRSGYRHGANHNPKKHRAINTPEENWSAKLFCWLALPRGWIVNVNLCKRLCNMEAGWLAGQTTGRIAGRIASRMIAGPDCWPGCWPDCWPDCWPGLLAGLLPGWPDGRLVGWLDGWLDGLVAWSKSANVKQKRTEN